MHSLELFVSISCILLSIGMLVYYRHMRNSNYQKMLHLRDTKRYKELFLQMDALENQWIDEIRIEACSVTVTCVYPARTLLKFTFKQNGECHRNADVARIIALLLAEDFPILRDHATYSFRRYRIFRFNGKMDYGYCFVMRCHCKQQVLAQQNSIRTLPKNY